MIQIRKVCGGVQEFAFFTGPLDDYDADNLGLRKHCFLRVEFGWGEVIHKKPLPNSLLTFRNSSGPPTCACHCILTADKMGVSLDNHKQFGFPAPLSSTIVKVSICLKLLSFSLISYAAIDNE